MKGASKKTPTRDPHQKSVHRIRHTRVAEGERKGKKGNFEARSRWEGGGTKKGRKIIAALPSIFGTATQCGTEEKGGEIVSSRTGPLKEKDLSQKRVLIKIGRSERPQQEGGATLFSSLYCPGQKTSGKWTKKPCHQSSPRVEGKNGSSKASGGGTLAFTGNQIGWGASQPRKKEEERTCFLSFINIIQREGRRTEFAEKVQKGNGRSC